MLSQSPRICSQGSHPLSPPLPAQPQPSPHGAYAWGASPPAGTGGPPPPGGATPVSSLCACTGTSALRLLGSTPAPTLQACEPRPDLRPPVPQSPLCKQGGDNDESANPVGLSQRPTCPTENTSTVPGRVARLRRQSPCRRPDICHNQAAGPQGTQHPQGRGVQSLTTPLPGLRGSMRRHRPERPIRNGASLLPAGRAEGRQVAAQRAASHRGPARRAGLKCRSRAKSKGHGLQVPAHRQIKSWRPEHWGAVEMMEPRIHPRAAGRSDLTRPRCGSLTHSPVPHPPAGSSLRPRGPGLWGRPEELPGSRLCAP